MIWREVEKWRHTTPEERLAELEKVCRHSAFFLSVLPAAVLELVLEREPLPDDTLALLETLRRAEQA